MVILLYSSDLVFLHGTKHRQLSLCSQYSLDMSLSLLVHPGCPSQMMIWLFKVAGWQALCHHNEPIVEVLNKRGQLGAGAWTSEEPCGAWMQGCVFKLGTCAGSCTPQLWIQVQAETPQAGLNAAFQSPVGFSVMVFSWAHFLTKANANEKLPRNSTA